VALWLSPYTHPTHTSYLTGVYTGGDVSAVSALRKKFLALLKHMSVPPPTHTRTPPSHIPAGVYTGGEAAAVSAVVGGQLSAVDFKFFAGALVWQDDELQRELDKGVW
jgi:hypothetical protein